MRLVTKVPNEFSVDIFAKKLSPRQMAEGSNGYIFVGSKIGNVYASRSRWEWQDSCYYYC